MPLGAEHPIPGCWSHHRPRAEPRRPCLIGRDSPCTAARSRRSRRTSKDTQSGPYAGVGGRWSCVASSGRMRGGLECSGEVCDASGPSGHHDPVADLAAVLGLGLNEIRRRVRHHCEHDRLRIGQFQLGLVQPHRGRVFAQLDDVDHDLVGADPFSSRVSTVKRAPSSSAAIVTAPCWSSTTCVSGSSASPITPISRRPSRRAITNNRRPPATSIS